MSAKKVTPKKTRKATPKRASTASKEPTHSLTNSATDETITWNGRGPTPRFMKQFLKANDFNMDLLLIANKAQWQPPEAEAASE